MTKLAASRVRITTFKRVAKSRKPVMVQVGGKDCAVIVPIEDAQLEQPTKKHARKRKTPPPLPPPPKAPKNDPTGWNAIDSLRGIVKHAAADLSENHDKYLYGEPPE